MECVMLPWWPWVLFPNTAVNQSPAGYKNPDKSNFIDTNVFNCNTMTSQVLKMGGGVMSH